MANYRYTILFTPAEEGGYVVTCPALPGLVTEGDTYEEARARAKEAIEGYIEVLIEDGKPIPVEPSPAPSEPFEERIQVTLPQVA